MQDIPRQVEKLPGAKHMAFPIDCDIDWTLDALNCDLARYLVWRQRFACSEHQAHDFEVVGLEKCNRLLGRQAASKRADVDRLSGLGVFDGHVGEYARWEVLRRLT